MDLGPQGREPPLGALDPKIKYFWGLEREIEMKIQISYTGCIYYIKILIFIYNKNLRPPGGLGLLNINKPWTINLFIN